MVLNISDCEGVKLLSGEFKSDRNKAIAKVVLATAAIVMSVAILYLMSSSVYLGLLSSDPYEILGAIIAAAIIGGTTAVVASPGLIVAPPQLLNAVKDILRANKLLEMVRNPEEKKEGLKILCSARKDVAAKEMENVDNTRFKLLSGEGSLEEIAYGQDWEVRHLINPEYTKEKAAKENNVLAHKMLTEVPVYARHTKKALAIGLIAAVAIPLIAFSTGNLYVLSAMAAPAALLAYGGAGQYILYRKWKRLTQLDTYQPFWKDKLPEGSYPKYSPEQYSTLGKRSTAFGSLLTELA